MNNSIQIEEKKVLNQRAPWVYLTESPFSDEPKSNRILEILF